MIISSQQVMSILQLQLSTPKKRPDNSSNVSPASKTGSLTLPSRTHELRFAREQVLKSPEVRTDKIVELKKQIQEGNYQVPAEHIVAKMIGRCLVDELAGR